MRNSFHLRGGCSSCSRCFGSPREQCVPNQKISLQELNSKQEREGKKKEGKKASGHLSCLLYPTHRAHRHRRALILWLRSGCKGLSLQASVASIHLLPRDHWASWDQAEGPGGEMTYHRPHSLCRQMQVRGQATCLHAWNLFKNSLCLSQEFLFKRLSHGIRFQRKLETELVGGALEERRDYPIGLVFPQVTADKPCWLSLGHWVLCRSGVRRS